jgi:hypothetical protein
LRDELSILRGHGGISEQFVDWHRRLVTCLGTITSDVPSCASLCAELMAIDFELPPEFTPSVPEGFADHRIVSAVSKSYFRNRCNEADEGMNTLMIALRHSEG